MDEIMATLPNKDRDEGDASTSYLWALGRAALILVLAWWVILYELVKHGVLK